MDQEEDQRFEGDEKAEQEGKATPAAGRSESADSHFFPRSKRIQKSSQQCNQKSEVTKKNIKILL